MQKLPDNLVQGLQWEAGIQDFSTLATVPIGIRLVGKILDSKLGGRIPGLAV